MGIKSVSLDREKTRVQISWSDGHVSRWNSLLLRRHCQCDSCSRYVDLTSLPASVVVQSVKIEGENFVMGVENDVIEKHVTTIPFEWLRENCYCDSCLHSNINRRNFQFVDPKTTPLPTVDYKEVEENETKGLFAVAEKVMKVGFCVLKNVPHEDSVVLKVAEMFGPVHETVTNKMFQVRVQKGPRNTAHTALGLPYHQDLPWYETEPGVQLLNAHKFDDDVIGGESQLVDLFRVAEILRDEDPEAFDDLARIPASFETKDFIRAKPAHYETLKPHIEVDYFGNVVAVHWNPGVEGTLRAHEEDIDRYYRGYNKMLNIIRRPELEWLFRMDAGDIMVFNNHRMVHARKVYSSKNDGQRHLQGCYINLDDMRSTYMRLAHELQTHVVPPKMGNKSSF